MRKDQNAAVAIWVAMLTPLLVIVLAFGIELVGWSVTKVEAQRAADLASISGAINYKSTSNPQTAATAAARMAQLNNGTGTASPTWDSGSKTLTDNQITAQIVSGIKTSSDTAIKVSVQKTVPQVVSGLLNGQSSVNITASSVAELVTTTTPGTGSQPCLVALSSTGSITGSGSTYISMPNCSIVSNNTIGVHGGGSLTTGGIYAAGAISIDNWIPATGQHPNNGKITDPYATNTTLQSALTAASSVSATSLACSNQTCTGLANGSYCNGMGTGSVSCTLKPGNYGGFAVTSGGPYTFTFSPGQYVFNGNMAFYGNNTLSGSNVTILTTGTFIGTNSFSITLTAPNSTAVSSTGGIAGIALAGNTTGTVTVSGNDKFSTTGAVYFPNAMFDASGSSGLGSTSTTCLEILAGSMKLTGSSYFNSSCSSVSATTFSSTPGTSSLTATLVQ